MNIIKTLSIGLIVGLLSLTNYSTAYAIFVTTVGANINVTAAVGNQTEATIAVDPTNPQRIFVAANLRNVPNPGSTAALSTNGGTTWTRFRIGTGTGVGGDGLPVSCCDNVAVFDQFGNLFLVYLSVGADGFVGPGSTDDTIELAMSTTGGGAGSFTILQQINGPGIVDQPTVTVGPGTAPGTGSVWVTWNRSAPGAVAGTIFARGASVTGLGTVGTFNAAQAAPNSMAVAGQFGDIAIGPAGQVMVTYQNDTQIFVNTDADGLGAGGFGAQVTATNTNVETFDDIPAQDSRTIDAEAGLVYDRSGGANNGRVYLVYTDEVPDESNDTDILVRSSNNNGTTWSAPVQVNDDTGTNSQFLPHIALDQTTGSLAVTWYDARNDTGVGAGTTNGIANDDAQFWGAFSTNGGTTFMPNFQISTGTSNEDVAGSGVDYADYSWSDSAFFSGGLFPVWSDNSNSTGDNPEGALSRFDIYTARVTLVDNRPPSVNAGADVSGDEGAVIPLVGTASDPNGDPLTTMWTFTPGAGVDAGAICTFDNATMLNTNITCTDDGTYTATLTASDGINPAVSDSVVVTVNNVAPTVTITAPSNGTSFLLSAPVNLTATFADVGTNDTHTCTTDWGDGSSTAAVVVETAGTGTCTDSHMFGSTGTYTIQVTITDDDGGTTTTSVTIIINAPPVVNAGSDVAGLEGSAIPLNGTVSDSDGDPLTITWTFTPGAGVDAGATCSFTDATLAATDITCTDDGIYTATFTASDGINPAVSDEVMVTVDNVAPEVTITMPSDGKRFRVNRPVGLSASFADAGTNDTHTCTTDWGDGSSTTAVVVETAGTGTCTDTHAYKAVGVYTIQVTITDDDGGTSTASVTIRIRRGGDDDDQDDEHDDDDNDGDDDNKDDNKGDRDD